LEKQAMPATTPSQLRFNFGFLLEAGLATSREIELDYPSIRLEEVLLRPLIGHFKATRTSNGIYITGALYTSVQAECARCLEKVMLETSFKLDDLFYFQAIAPEGEFIIGDDGIIDLGPLVRELSLLEIPIQPCCTPDCQGLCSECGQNLNEKQCDCVVDTIDPRMAVLRDLLNPN